MLKTVTCALVLLSHFNSGFGSNMSPCHCNASKIDTPEKAIREYVQCLAPLERQMNLAYWNFSTTGEEKYSEEMKNTLIEMRKMHACPGKYKMLLELEQQFLTSASDPQLLRQFERMMLSYRENQVPLDLIEKMSGEEVAIEGMYVNYRPVFQGKTVSNNDLREILAKSENAPERKEAWEALKEIGGQVESKVLELVALRNEAAQKAGFSDFYSMRLELQEIHIEKLFKLLDELEELTNPYWKIYKGKLDEKLAEKFEIEKSALRPWHYHDDFFQRAPSSEIDFDSFYKGKDVALISQDFYNRLGFNVDDILVHSDLYEREKKNQHAFCTRIDHAQDVRILCNLKDNEKWMGTQLHELGHAVYDKYLNQDLPFLLNEYAHISTTEAIAMLFGRLSQNRSFLEEYCGLVAELSENFSKNCEKAVAADLLVFARWILVMCHFERELYQNPSADFRALWWDYVEKYQGITRPDNRYLPDWAAKIHLACVPVYYQNYILGEMTASQLLDRMRKLAQEEGKSLVTSPTTATFLKENLFNLGACYPWEETIEKATGEPLTASYFANDLKVLAE